MPSPFSKTIRKWIDCFKLRCNSRLLAFVQAYWIAPNFGEVPHFERMRIEKKLKCSTPSSKSSVASQRPCWIEPSGWCADQLPPHLLCILQRHVVKMTNMEFSWRTANVSVVFAQTTSMYIKFRAVDRQSIWSFSYAIDCSSFPIH